MAKRRAGPRPARASSKKTVPKSDPARARTAPKSSVRTPARSAAGAEPAPVPEVVAPRLPGGRRHLLSLAFLRDGDEFFARIESNAGQITEFKNRALDQLLTLVAGELEDLLE